MQASWHDLLKTVWLLCGEAQQVGCLQGLEVCRGEATGGETGRATLLFSIFSHFLL